MEVYIMYSEGKWRAFDTVTNRQVQYAWLYSTLRGMLKMSNIRVIAVRRREL